MTAIQESLNWLRPLHFNLMTTEDVINECGPDSGLTAEKVDHEYGLLAAAGMCFKHGEDDPHLAGCWDLTEAGEKLLRDHGELE